MAEIVNFAVPKRGESMRVKSNILLLCLLCGWNVFAQSPDSLLNAARRFKSEYSFRKALEYYEQLDSLEISPQTRDSLALEKSFCDNALTVTEKVPLLHVVARARFSRNDFYLYYPLKDGSFRPAGEGMPLYYTGESDTLYVSRNDDVEMLFPMTVGDRMYFSSDKMGGYGGYDLFCCSWDDELGEWGEPVNMGFPYSSSADDLLYAQTEDGKYEVFASSRSCHSDSVYVYVIDKRASVDYSTGASPSDLSVIAQLDPQNNDLLLLDWADSGEDPWSERYEQIIVREKELQDIISSSDEDTSMYLKELDALGEEKKRVESHIFNRNTRTRDISNDVDKEVVGVDGSFIFIKKNLGKPLQIVYNED